MSITELIENGANVTLAISANDLRAWHKEVIEDTKKQLEESIVSEKTETYLTAKQVCDMLNINVTTLWRWEKKKYLIPVKVGSERRFRLSDVKEILEGGRG